MDPLNVGGMSLDALIEREWLITNGVGGYACSTSVGLNTRKYHGLLVAAMTPLVTTDRSPRHGCRSARGI